MIAVDIKAFVSLGPDRCEFCGGFTHDTTDCPRAEAELRTRQPIRGLPDGEVNVRVVEP